MHPTLRACLELCRVSNLPTVWTNVLAAGLLSGAPTGPGFYLLGCVSLSAFYTAGMCLNDVWDVAVDRERRPDRPLPSGRLGMGQAWLLVTALFAVALASLAPAPHREGLLGGLALAGAIVAYDRYHHGNPWSPLLMGGCRFLLFVTVALAAAGILAWPVLLAGTLHFLYVIGVSVAARLEPREGYGFACIPLLLAGICLLDGALLGYFRGWAWGAVGAAGFALVLWGQRFTRGD